MAAYHFELFVQNVTFEILKNLGNSEKSRKKRIRQKKSGVTRDGQFKLKWYSAISRIPPPT